MDEPLPPLPLPALPPMRLPFLDKPSKADEEAAALMTFIGIAAFALFAGIVVARWLA